MKCLNTLSSSPTNIGRSFWRLRLLAFCLLFFSILNASGCAIPENVEAIQRDLMEVKNEVIKIRVDTNTGLKTFKIVLDDLGITSEEGQRKLDKAYARRDEELDKLYEKHEEEKKHREKQEGFLEMILNLIYAMGSLYLADKFKILKAGGNIIKKITGINKDKKEKA